MDLIGELKTKFCYARLMILNTKLANYNFFVGVECCGLFYCAVFPDLLRRLSFRAFSNRLRLRLGMAIQSLVRKGKSKLKG
jgi:hypothetical protein